MGGVSLFTDFFVVCHGDSSTHIQAISDHIYRKLRDLRTRPDHIEGKGADPTWVLMDYGDIVVHIFNPESREYYSLEKLWLDAPRIEFEEHPPDLGRSNKRLVHP